MGGASIKKTPVQSHLRIFPPMAGDGCLPCSPSTEGLEAQGKSSRSSRTRIIADSCAAARQKCRFAKSDCDNAKSGQILVDRGSLRGTLTLCGYRPGVGLPRIYAHLDGDCVE
jgi:hypothetical protein